MTGCGCLLVVLALGAILYVLLGGSTDAGEEVAQAAALAGGLGLYALVARAGRRSRQEVARS